MRDPEEDVRTISGVTSHPGVLGVPDSGRSHDGGRRRVEGGRKGCGRWIPDEVTDPGDLSSVGHQ